MSVDVGEPILISALEHYTYCPRQAALIHVDGVWVPNEHTVRGDYGHQRADSPMHRVERGRVVYRAVQLWSERLGLSGRADAVELWPNGSLSPVEYKIGRRQGSTADVQLCAEAMCLEEMAGREVTHGYVWYAATRRRERVGFDLSLRQRTLETITAVRAMFTERRLPIAPADERCRHCQLHQHCMPDLVSHPVDVNAYLHNEVLECGS